MPIAQSTSYQGATAIHAGYFPGGKAGGSAGEGSDLPAGGATPGWAVTGGGGAIVDSDVAAGSATGPHTPTWVTARRTAGAMVIANVSSNTIYSLDPAMDPAVNPLYNATHATAPWLPNTDTLADFIDGWGTFAYDQTAKIAGCGPGGGHANAQLNNFFSANMRADTPGFSMRGYPTGSIQFPLPSGKTIYDIGANSSQLADGRMASVHPYRGWVASPADFFQLPGGGRGVAAGAGSFNSVGNRWDMATDNWDMSVSYATAASGFDAAGGCYYGPQDALWSIQNRTLTKWDRATGTRTTPPNSGDLLGFYCTMIPDTARGIIWVFVYANGGGTMANIGLAYFDPTLSSPVYHACTVDTPVYYGGKGIVLDATRNRFIIDDGSATLGTLAIPVSISSGTFVTGTLAYTGSKDAAPLNGVRGCMWIDLDYDTLCWCAGTQKFIQACSLS